jgi:hypothetical protein
LTAGGKHPSDRFSTPSLSYDHYVQICCACFDFSVVTYGDITISFNGGKSRYHAFQAKFDWRFIAGINILSSLTLSQSKDNGSGSLENPNGNLKLNF